MGKLEPRNLGFRMPNGHVSWNLCDRDALLEREGKITALKGFENMCWPNLVDFRPHPRTKNQGQFINWLRFSRSDLESVEEMEVKVDAIICALEFPELCIPMSP